MGDVFDYEQMVDGILAESEWSRGLRDLASFAERHGIEDHGCVVYVEQEDQADMVLRVGEYGGSWEPWNGELVRRFGPHSVVLCARKYSDRDWQESTVLPDGVRAVGGCSFCGRIAALRLDENGGTRLCDECVERLGEDVAADEGESGRGVA